MNESLPPATNAAQIDYWNSTVGQTWVQYQSQLDRQIEPLGREAMRVLAPAAGERIVDIGCGCGQTSLALAAQLGADGAVIGVDISAPMLEVARQRVRSASAAPLEFRELDAQQGDLGQGVFDAAFSRFGVMFFSDPLAAFRNIRGSLKPSGRLAFVCWRPLDQNIWMKTPMDAARPFLPPLPPPDPLAPGPFAFADPVRLRGILEHAGFLSVSIEPFDALIGSGDLEQTLQLTFKVGSLGSALREHPDRQPLVSGAVRSALQPFDTPDGVLMPAAVWIVRAVNP